MTLTFVGVANPVTQASITPTSIVISRLLGTYNPAASGTWTSGAIYPQVGDEMYVIMEANGGGFTKSTTVPATVIPSIADTGYQLLVDNPYSEGNTTARGVFIWKKIATSADAAAGNVTINYSQQATSGAKVIASIIVLRPGAGESTQLTPSLFWGFSGSHTRETIPQVASAPDAVVGDFVLRLSIGFIAAAAFSDKTHVKHDQAYNAASGGSLLTDQGTTLVEGTAAGQYLSVGMSRIVTNGTAEWRYMPIVNQADATATSTNAQGITLVLHSVTATAPVNSAAPVVTGTAAVGSVLTTTQGTWAPTPSSYAYQWQRDGVAISGATGTTYTTVSADAGTAVRCAVTATNGVGSATSNSNAISVPAAPVNTVAPAITTDSTPATGETITVSTGTWTGTGITYAYQWFRGVSPISAETTSSYLLAVTDEGASITCRVTATNGGGTATANSNAITPAVTAPLTDASFLNYLSGGSSNTDPALSIGGSRGGTYGGGLNALIGPILGSVALAGGTFYRVVYVRNTHSSATAAGLKLFLEQQFTSSGLTLAVAVPTEAANTTVPALASQTTAPTGVTWTTATTAAGGLAFGDLAAGASRGIYLRITVAPGTPITAEADAVVAVEGTAA